MKAPTKETVVLVLTVHVAILLLIGGGLNALGAAIALAIPTVSTLVFIAYHQGVDSIRKQKNIKRVEKPLSVVPGICSFRG